MAKIALYVKKQIRLDRLNFKQREMVKIGTVALAAVKNRVAAAQGPDDSAAKPLTKRYAIRKTQLGLGNRRNLNFTGSMMRNISLRSVSENSAVARPTSAKERNKAQANSKIEEFLVFSPKNTVSTVRAAEQVFQEQSKRIVLETFLNNK